MIETKDTEIIEAYQRLKFAELLEPLIKNIREKATAQFEYNVKENAPRGIMTWNEIAEKGVAMGLVTALGGFVEWDIQKALNLAGDLAEDVNAHSEAAKIRAMAEAA